MCVESLQNYHKQFCAIPSFSFIYMLSHSSGFSEAKLEKSTNHTTLMWLELVLGKYIYFVCGYITVLGGYQNFQTHVGSHFPKITYKRVQFSPFFCFFFLYTGVGYQILKKNWTSSHNAGSHKFENSQLSIKVLTNQLLLFSN